MKQERMILSSTSYPTIQCGGSIGVLVSVEDIPMMSDEHWNRLTNTSEQKKLREKFCAKKKRWT